MNYSLDWNLSDTNLTFVVLGCTLIYVIFHYFFSAGSWLKRINLTDLELKQSLAIYRQRISGGLTLGLLPLGLISYRFNYSISELGLTIGNSKAVLPALGLFIVLLPILWVSAGKEEQQKIYPQIRKSVWNQNDIIKSINTWILYLLGYEIMFRGVLLFSLTYLIGAWPSVIISTAIYVLVHLPKKAGETIACFFMGFFFSWLALVSGSFLTAWILHSLIACCSEIFTFYRHPKMKFERNN